ncbi:hypothetical protein A2704_06485 [Candidatus Kaiserbacteria bacterium RIFCSPHIGHO2_01_FULL_54_36b]|uniref:Uncharacterized protein n=1 Tax=Candidatus Kaiserbacteria bacterium RIFCSPHIGHO2_01_FULL_54_36b TaxID=1798483 RepID=A0A1F6CP03_9BACT|nr:MAG: hypothetical protein A2704_06485 [Candidatus Kaiserbacteria bacterium RIFCSPHIGHO2_01_FULL_54_36b]
MIDQKFVGYIRNQLAAGIARVDIEKALRINGLSDQDIAEGFTAVETTSPHPESQSAAMPAPQPAAVPAQVTSRPVSIKYFELLMYLSMAVSLATTLYLYIGQIASLDMAIVLAVPALMIAGRLLLVWLAAHRRVRWARVTLLAFFLYNIFGILGIVSAFFYNPLSAVLSTLPILLEAAALYFAFSSASNLWYDPAGQTSLGAASVPGKSRVWTAVIPGINISFLAGYLGLLLGIDYPILQAQPELARFWYIMLAVFAIFAVFFLLETFIFRQKFATTRSGSDGGVVTIVVIRNIIFLLNFIPGIQLIGMAALPTVGSVLLIAYIGLIVRRSRGLEKLRA